MRQPVRPRNRSVNADGYVTETYKRLDYKKNSCHNRHGHIENKKQTPTHDNSVNSATMPFSPTPTPNMRLSQAIPTIRKTGSDITRSRHAIFHKNFSIGVGNSNAHAERCIAPYMAGRRKSKSPCVRSLRSPRSVAVSDPIAPDSVWEDVRSRFFALEEQRS